ncbi:MAG: hypothetical protein JW395_2481 [Nitrospira sp.]|nr:hypothetical protein [Nitrospira sp.]
MGPRLVMGLMKGFDDWLPAWCALKSVCHERRFELGPPPLLIPLEGQTASHSPFGCSSFVRGVGGT